MELEVITEKFEWVLILELVVKNCEPLNCDSWSIKY